MEKYKNISVTEAAKRMGKNPQFVRIGLQQSRFPFGTAVKTGEKKWDYHISETALEEYLTGTIKLKRYFEENLNIIKSILETNSEK